MTPQLLKELYLAYLTSLTDALDDVIEDLLAERRDIVTQRREMLGLDPEHAPDAEAKKYFRSPRTH